MNRSGANARAIGGTGLAICLGAEATAGLLGFAGTVHLAGRLGPSGLPALEASTALAAWMLVLVRGGLDQIVVREAARHPALIGRLGDHLLGLRCAWAAVGLSLIGLIGSSLALASAMILIPSALVADVGPRARNELTFLAAIGAIRAVGVFVAVVGWVARPGDLVGAALAPAVGETLVALVCWLRSVAGGYRPRPRFRPRVAAALSRRAAVAGATRLGRVGIYAADAMALGLASGEGLGAYAAGRRLAMAIVAVGIVVPSLFGADLARAWTQGAVAASRAVGRGLTVLLGLFVPAGLGLALTAGRMLPWLFGGDYEAGASLLAWIAARVPVLLLATWLHAALVAFGREAEALRSIALVAAVAAVLVPLGAIGGGAAGIGAAILGVEGLAAVLGWGRVRRLGVDPGRFCNIRPIGVGCLLMMLGVTLAGTMPVPVVCAVGGVSYAAGWGATTLWPSPRTRGRSARGARVA